MSTPNSFYPSLAGPPSRGETDLPKTIKEVLRDLDSRNVNDMHRSSDADLRTDAQHHTIGLGRYQVSSGDHSHDGTNSQFLLDGVTFSGSRSGATATILEQVLQALVLLGASDATSA